MSRNQKKGKNMGLWNKIVLGVKFMFGGFESATDYLLKLLNDFLNSEGVSGNVQKFREFAITIIKYLTKYEKYCPAIWANDYLRLKAAIQTIPDALEDGSLTKEEIENVIGSVKDAIENWMK